MIQLTSKWRGAKNFTKIELLECKVGKNHDDRTFTPIYLHFTDLLYPGKT